MSKYNIWLTRKPALKIKSSINGWILGINLLLLAINKIPKIPITFNPKLIAFFLPGFSSIITLSAFEEIAKAIVSDSPRCNSFCNSSNNTNGDIRVQSNYFNSTSNISSMTVSPSGSWNFVTGTKFALYGIKG